MSTCVCIPLLPQRPINYVWGWPVMRRRRCQSGHPSVGRDKISSNPKTCLSTDDFVSPGAPRIPLGRAKSRGTQGLLAVKTTPWRLKFGQVASKLPPRRPQEGSRRQDDGKMAATSPQDANLTPTWAQLGPTWAHLGPTWPQRGAILDSLRVQKRNTYYVFGHF